MLWHAGLPPYDWRGDGPSVADCTWPANGLGDRLGDAVADFIQALAQLNHELHGPVPSEREPGDPDIPAQVAYAVAEVLRMLREYEQDHPVTSPSPMWLVETAWLAVLAGDIDDVHAHLAEEWAARS